VLEEDAEDVAVVVADELLACEGVDEDEEVEDPEGVDDGGARA
jgi:hypothetical protein